MESNQEEQPKEVVEVENLGVAEIEAIPAITTLTSLITDLHKTLDEARNVIVRYQQKSNDLDIREKHVFQREVTVDSRSKDLIGREAACEKVENIQALHKDAIARHDAANLRVNAAVEAEAHLSRSTSEQTSKLNEDRKQTQIEANNVLKQRTAIEVEVSKRVTKALEDMGITKAPEAVSSVEAPKV